MKKQLLIILFSFFWVGWQAVLPCDGFTAEKKLYTLDIEFFKETAGKNMNVLAVVWLNIAKGHYSYAHNPGEIGLPLKLGLRIDQGPVLPVVYPAGDVQPDNFDPSVNVRVYKEKTPFFIRLKDFSPDVKELHGLLSLGICSKSQCFPVQEKLAVPITTLNFEALADARNFFWYDFYLKKKGDIDLVSVTANPSQAASLLQAWDFKPRYFHQNLEIETIWLALFWAFIAGFVLNFMPCVLPIISLKLSTFITGSTQKGGSLLQKSGFKEHNIFYSLGVLAYFLGLGGLLSGLGLAWGEIFQHSWLILTLACLVFALALSLFGIWTLPGIDLKAEAPATAPKTRAFFTGLLITLLATPCSGPFLGGVLAWVLLQPPMVIILIFFFIGLGMAAPFLILIFFPGLIRFLPKPGGWMRYLEVVVGFFLMGAVLHLLSILPEKMLISSLILLLFIAAAVFVWGKFTNLSQSFTKRATIRSISLLLVIGAALWLFVPGAMSPVIKWQNFEAHSFKNSLGQQPMLVEFTADWCPTCKVLEHSVLTEENLDTWQKQYSLTLVKVDLTLENPEGLALLNSLGAKSIPLTALFPVGSEHKKPLVLRDIFTTNQMEQALERVIH